MYTNTAIIEVTNNTAIPKHHFHRITPDEFKKCCVVEVNIKRLSTHEIEKCFTKSKWNRIRIGL